MEETIFELFVRMLKWVGAVMLGVVVGTHVLEGHRKAMKELELDDPDPQVNVDRAKTTGAEGVGHNTLRSTLTAAHGWASMPFKAAGEASRRATLYVHAPKRVKEAKIRIVEAENARVEELAKGLQNSCSPLSVEELKAVLVAAKERGVDLSTLDLSTAQVQVG